MEAKGGTKIIIATNIIETIEAPTIYLLEKKPTLNKECDDLIL